MLQTATRYEGLLVIVSMWLEETRGTQVTTELKGDKAQEPQGNVKKVLGNLRKDELGLLDRGFRLFYL